jgi:hypothetical protein
MYSRVYFKPPAGSGAKLALASLVGGCAKMGKEHAWEALGLSSNKSHAQTEILPADI